MRPLLLIITLCFVDAFLITANAQASPNPSPDDYFISPTLRTDESVLYEFDFPSTPLSLIGEADMLVLNTGSVNSHVTSITTSLYIENEFVGSAKWFTGTAFALFISSASSYNGFFPATTVDYTEINGLFAGTKSGTLVISPEFDSPLGFVYLSGWFLHAASATGIVSAVDSPWEDIFPSARILSTSVQAIPEPKTYALMLAGLAVVGAAARRRQLACAKAMEATT